MIVSRYLHDVYLIAQIFLGLGNDVLVGDLFLNLSHPLDELRESFVAQLVLFFDSLLQFQRRLTKMLYSLPRPGL